MDRPQRRSTIGGRVKGTSSEEHTTTTSTKGVGNRIILMKRNTPMKKTLRLIACEISEKLIERKLRKRRDIMQKRGKG
jgi:hypothetical protein